MTDDNSKPNDDLETRSADGSSGDKRPLPTIDRIASFRIDKTISSGGGGTVFLAYDESMKRKVALKVLHPSLSITHTAQQRFAREAWIAGQLEHANIIKVYSRGEDKQLHYIAMEFADGGSLSDYIKNLRETASASDDITATANREHIKFIVSKFIELVGALEHIHSRGFIHRDIKPHNILLSGESKQFKLTDFGIAHAEDMTRMTKAGDFMGTIHYMSPEQISAHRTKVDKRTDIYSLGVTLYEALTLSLPFEGDSEEKLIGEIIAGHYIPARKRSKIIPRDLETILIKATHHDPQRRYQSAMDFAEDLRRFLEDRPIKARRDSLLYKASKNLSLKKRSTQISLGVLVLLILSVTFITKVQQNQYDKEKIITTLKRAIETRTSPFEFEPDWERLSHKLYDHILTGKVDSLTKLFFKANSLCKYNPIKYSWRGKGKISIKLFSLNLFSKKFQPANQLVIPLKTVNEFSVDNSPFAHASHFIQQYGKDKSTTCGSGSTIGALIKSLKSKHIIKLRTISYHYYDALCYTKPIAESKQNSKSEELAIESLKLSSLNNGETLVAKRGMWCAVGGGKEPSSIQILNTSSLRRSEPIFVDTVIDSFNVLIFNTYPEDFPKRVSSDSLRRQVENSLSISKIEIFRYGNESFGTLITGQFEFDSLPIPIAGSFLAKGNSAGTTIFEEEVRIRVDGSFDIYFDNSQGLSLGTTKQIFRHSKTVDFGELEFDEVVKLGQIEAKLLLIPAIEVARIFGDIDEFWGDTLIFDITFQAILETKLDSEIKMRLSD